jgi:hypothetical protein
VKEESVDMEPPDDHDDDEPSMKEEELPPPAPVEEPVVVGYSEADFENMLGSYNELALHVVIGDDNDDDHHEPRPRVGRYERRDP